MLPTRVRAGRIAHQGMAPAMTGQADQRGYERATQWRISSRAYVSDSAGLFEQKNCARAIFCELEPGSACPVIAGLPRAPVAREGTPCRAIRPARTRVGSALSPRAKSRAIARLQERFEPPPPRR